LRGSAAGRPPPEERVHKQSETPTVKTAGVFTIADFDNNSNLKHVRGQSIPASATLAPIRSLSGRVGPTCRAPQTRSEQAVRLFGGVLHEGPVSFHQDESGLSDQQQA
jgi:hypothetical protein